VIRAVVDALPAFAAVLRREQALRFDPEQQLLADGVVAPIGRIIDALALRHLDGLGCQVLRGHGCRRQCQKRQRRAQSNSFHEAFI
jgi:hypothetical protein